jgi:colanic acid biosynthesis glycosyl transferase WcaI
MNYAPEMAGVGRYNGEIAEYFASEGAEVTVVTTSPHYPGWKAIGDYRTDRYQNETLRGVRVIRCPLWLHSPMDGVWRLLAPLSFAISSAPLAFWRIVADRPDVVLCIEPTLLGAPVAQFAARLAGSKVVLHAQDLEVDACFAVGHLASIGWLKALAFAFERFTLRRFAHIVTISNRMADKLFEKGVSRERISVVRNWVDLEAIRPLKRVSSYRAELGLADGAKVALYSGNIGAKQGLETVVEAAARLRARSDIVFIIAGEGPAKPALQVQAANLPNVRFLPFQPYARLSEFLGVADLHVLPQSAGMADLVLPSKLGGMLASGKRLVVTATHGTELVDFLGDCADLAPPGDSRALADAIETGLSRPESDHESEKRLKLSRRLARSDGLRAFAAILMQGQGPEASGEPSPSLVGRFRRRAPARA